MKTTTTKSSKNNTLKPHLSKTFFNKVGSGGYLDKAEKNQNPFFKPLTIQTKLSLDPSNDKSEQFTNGVAHQEKTVPYFPTNFNQVPTSTVQRQSATDAKMDRAGQDTGQREHEQDIAGSNDQISSTSSNLIQRYLVGPPQRVGMTIVTAPTYGNCRSFNMQNSWDTDLRNGFIIQEITNGDSITRCSDGSSMPAPNTPHYFEAWEVDGSGNISNGNLDTWRRGGRSATSGWWTMNSNVFAHSGPLDPAWGFQANSVPDAGSLLATTTGPSRSDLYQPSLTRRRGGTWNCCDGENTHEPS